MSQLEGPGDNGGREQCDKHPKTRVLPVWAWPGAVALPGNGEKCKLVEKTVWVGLASRAYSPPSDLGNQVPAREPGQASAQAAL